jgi:hypothetical protein
MSEEINQQRRGFLGAAAMAVAATQLGMIGPARAQRVARSPMAKSFLAVRAARRQS